MNIGYDRNKQLCVVERFRFVNTER